MSDNKTINVRELLDNRDVSSYQKFIVFLCFLIVVMDGFDVVIMGFVAPALKEAWQWSNKDLAPVISAALFGLTFGALTAGPLGDKFGRRKVLTASVFIFGLFTLLVAMASSKTEFIIYRFIAGFAMGGIMPMVATLVKEYSPARRAALLVTFVFAGFTVGAAGGGFLAKWMVPELGWQSVFYLGGILPIITAVLMLFVMPESLTYMVHKRGNQAEIRQIIERCAPGSTQADSQFTVPAEATGAQGNENPIKIALNSHYRLGSFMLWIAYFMHLFLVYLLGSWMPTMINESGMTASQAVIISTMFQLGGPLGSITLGWFMDRFEQHRVIQTAYAIGAVFLVIMSYIGGEYALMCIVAFVIGAGFNGGGTAMNALSTNFFPLPARATGNSWMHGIGRTGAILSSFAGAWMLDAGWKFDTIALVLTIPTTCIIVLLLVKFLRYRNEA